VYYKPFIVWLWGGALLMALGGGIAASDRRYRLKKTATVTIGAAGAAA
jgi:cytochrome c-type biogenesis protein CcmF